MFQKTHTVDVVGQLLDPLAHRRLRFPSPINNVKEPAPVTSPL
jgi:hypothetical protein